MKIEFLREIAAPKELVWQVITDFSAYREWNPFVTACDAELRAGAPISMTVVLGKNVPRPGRVCQSGYPRRVV